VYVQDQSGGVVWGMLGCVATAGHAGQVLLFDHLAEEVVRATTPQRAAKAQVRSFPGAGSTTKSLET